MSQFAWCAGAMACHAVMDCMNASFKQQVRLAYFFFDGIFVSLGVLLLYGLSNLLAGWSFIQTILSTYIKCQDSGGKDDFASCLGVSSIYRLSAALVAMHLIILFMLLLRNGCSKVWNEEIWMFKILMIIVTFAGSMLIPNEKFQIYANVAMVFSTIFLLFQIVMLIDLFYAWGVNWVENYDKGGNCWMYLLIFSTIALYCGAIYFIVDSFRSFYGIGIGTFACISNLIFVLVSAILVLIRLNPDASLLTAAAFSLITSFLTWSGLSNMDDVRVKPSEATTIISLIIGVLFIATSLIYISVGDAEESSGQMAAGGVNIPQAVLADKTEDDEKRKMLDEEERAGTQTANAQEKKVEVTLRIYQTNSFIYFHIILLFSSFYIAMLLSNWGNPIVNDKPFTDFKAGNRSMWMRLGTTWVTTVLYIWTLIAPAVCPDRDFS